MRYPILRWAIAACAAFCLVFAFSPQARAELRVPITEGHLDPMPIAIPDFIGADARARSSAATSPA